MSRREEHERYLQKTILSKNFSSSSSLEFINKNNAKKSKDYFESFKNLLLNKYLDKSFKDIDNLSIVSNDYGETINIRNTFDVDFNFKEINFKKSLLNNLKLVPGIGVKKEKRLKEKGYKTLEHLIENDKYGFKASKIIDEIKEADFNCLMNIVKKDKYTKDSKLNQLRCASLTDKENFKFMDIETLGLSNVPIILLGIAEIKNNKIISNQYLIRDINEEPALLDAYLSHLDSDSVHVTFNGARFDIPFIKNRCNYFRMNYNLDLNHLDLYLFAKTLWKEELPNCKLSTIEKYKLGIKRDDDVPGAYIPDYYKTYLEKDNIGPLIPIIEHNCQDIVSLASFLNKIHDEVI